MSYEVHAVPGRLRIKIPGMRRNVRLAQEVNHRLNSLFGVESTSANTLTGSVIVCYDPEVITPSTILTFLSRENYIDSTKAVVNEQPAGGTFARASEVACKALLGLALDHAFKGSPLSILAAFI